MDFYRYILRFYYEISINPLFVNTNQNKSQLSQFLSIYSVSKQMNHTFKESLPESNSITEAVCCACCTLTIQVKRNVGSMYGMESQHVQTCFKTCPNLFLKHVQTCSYIVSLTAILLLVTFFPWETSGFAIPLW